MKILERLIDSKDRAAMIDPFDATLSDLQQSEPQRRTDAAAAFLAQHLPAETNGHRCPR
jgi:hypothetical protein